MDVSAVTMDSHLDLTATDATGQRRLKARAVRTDATVGEVVSALVKKLQLPETDSRGTQHVFHAYLRDGRHLHADQVVGEVLKNDDEIILQPDVQAGLDSDR